MASVAIVTDSTADIPQELRERLDITVVPLKVIFGSEEFLDGIDLTPSAFYQKMTNSPVLPTTSQPSPADFFDVFKRLTEAGKSIVSIHLSGALSGTYQSAVIAKSMLEDEGDVTVIDACSASYGYGMIVVRAAEMAAQGEDAESIVQEIQRMRRELRLFFIVDTLEYLQKGGRIGKAAAVLGSLLNIKPILTIDDEGVINPVEKARGQKRAIARIAELLVNDVGSQPVQLGIALTPGFDEQAKILSELLRSKLQVASYTEAEIGPVVGAHAGPGTVGVFVVPAS